MVRSCVVVSLVFAAACGDSVAQEGETSTGGSTGASESASTTGGGVSEPTGGEATQGGESEAGETAPSTGGTTVDPGEGESETGEPVATCYESDIYTSVAELTAERLKGFNCITGNVTITDGTGPDLGFLREIRSIGGFLKILGPHSLVSLHGLEKLESVGGRMYFGETPELTDASALASLVSVGGDLEFLAAPKLMALDLGALTTLDGSFLLSASLASLDVRGLTILPGELVLEDTQLSTLAGLAGLTSLTGLRLAGNPQLVDLSGLTALEQMSGRLELEYNASLTNIDGLKGLTKLSRLEVRVNPKLTSLAPLADVTVDKVLIIVDTAVQSLPPLHGEVNHFDVSNNGALVSLAGLEGVAVSHHLVIEHNDTLVDLKGLGGAADEMTQVWIRYNAGLESLDGWSGPAVVDQLDIIDNPQLASLGALTGLQSAGALTIVGNKVQALPELAGLTSLDVLYVGQNPALTALNGLEDLESVGVLHIRDNPKLSTLAALQGGALTEVIGEYDVSGNAQLPSCTAKALYDSLTAPPMSFCYDNMPDMCSGLGGCIFLPTP